MLFDAVAFVGSVGPCGRCRARRRLACCEYCMLPMLPHTACCAASHGACCTVRLWMCRVHICLALRTWFARFARSKRVFREIFTARYVGAQSYSSVISSRVVTLPCPQITIFERKRVTGAHSGQSAISETAELQYRVNDGSVRVGRVGVAV